MQDPVSTGRRSKNIKGTDRKKRRKSSGRDGSKGLVIVRRWTTAGVDPLEEVTWEQRSAVITGEGGKIVFEQTDVEVPADWSQLATNVVVSKYFRGAPGTSERETSVKQLILRVVDTIVSWARKDSYFATLGDLDAFCDELKFLLVHQYACFNSPVWFNVGVVEHPQCSACFINSIEDNMESILQLARTEAMLFRYGSGSGTNLSPLRGSKESIRGGGKASGPVSFMRGYDAFAGVIKSGGKTRRSAKMVMLDVDHPDVVDFIRCKTLEEKKAWTLIDSGYEGSFDGEAYRSVYFQNANHSVRVPDTFMKAVERDGSWKTVNRVDGEVADTYQARDILREISENAWVTGDPGLQFDSTINTWHTCKATDRIYASNPCSEYIFLNDTACNLASLNLMKFRDEEGELDVDGLKHAVDIVFTAQEVLVDNASYPTDRIAENSHAYRPLGLGYANLGALLMARGLPYDSDEGRTYAAAVTAIMCGEAYAQSARMAKEKGPFSGYEQNCEGMADVMETHRDAVDDLDPQRLPKGLLSAARQTWSDAVALGNEHGYRNAQATVLAPTGTIGFMMDCDTTGIEPDISLIKYKKLVGGGFLKIVNRTVPVALDNLGYSDAVKAEILDYLEREETIEGAPGLEAGDLGVFDCAFKAQKGQRSIEPMGHLRMMAAVQPFLSGAISKTVNMPTETTAEDIYQTYIKAWKLGLKAIAIYRDGCKRSQPLNTGKVDDDKPEVVEARPVRRRLPDERQALTHKFSIAGHEGYITVGLYDDGTPGEVFITMSKEGSTISGMMDSFATSVSLALQYGVPVDILAEKFIHSRYEPSGFTGNKAIPIAKSITDYIFRWMKLRFIEDEATSADHASATAGVVELSVPAPSVVPLEQREKTVFALQADAPSCADCGSIMIRNGSCYKCLNCGSTSGCS